MIEASVGFMLDESFGGIDSVPPLLSPNEIEATVIDMRNKGSFYVTRLCKPPQSIYEWRDEQLKRWSESLA